MSDPVFLIFVVIGACAFVGLVISSLFGKSKEPDEISFEEWQARRSDKPAPVPGADVATGYSMLSPGSPAAPKAPGSDAKYAGGDHSDRIADAARFANKRHDTYYAGRKAKLINGKTHVLDDSGNWVLPAALGLMVGMSLNESSHADDSSYDSGDSWDSGSDSSWDSGGFDGGGF